MLSDSETTTDLSDKNCTGEELDMENFQNLPKVVSQSTGVGGGIKRPVNSVDHLDLKRPKRDEVRIGHWSVLRCIRANPIDLVLFDGSHRGHDYHYGGHEWFQQWTGGDHFRDSSRRTTTSLNGESRWSNRFVTLLEYHGGPRATRPICLADACTDTPLVDSSTETETKSAQTLETMAGE